MVLLTVTVALALICAELYRRIRQMSASLDRLTVAVNANTAAVDAAIVAIGAQHTGTPDAALDALSAVVEANNAKLVAATPAVTP